MALKKSLGIVFLMIFYGLYHAIFWRRIFGSLFPSIEESQIQDNSGKIFITILLGDLGPTISKNTLPETNSLHLKMDGLEYDRFLLGRPISGAMLVYRRVIRKKLTLQCFNVSIHLRESEALKTTWPSMVIIQPPYLNRTWHLISNKKLDGGFNFFLCSPRTLQKMNQILRNIFFKEVANNHHLERHFALFPAILLHIALYNHYRIYI